ncbi:MAG: DUF3631 domain-containing protein [Pseudomonadales bacterium]|jgi:hypothetical protein|nr:DUF3631 domain-containing protein [Pseudomonadales bacterium]
MNDYDSKVAALRATTTAAERDGAGILEALLTFIRRFCYFSTEHALVAVVLWAAHAHMVKHFHTTPRLALLSPEPGSGKTRVLEVLATLVPSPMFSLSASPAAVFRTLAEEQIALLFDEVDTVFSTRGKDDTNEDLRALLNAGYKRGARIPRCVGPKHEVQHFDVFCAAALAGLGNLPDTIMTRSIVIRMQRRAPDEHVEPWRGRVHEPQGAALRTRLAAWAADVGEQVGEAWPELPDGIVDRPAEVWEPLVALADAAGGEWPERARRACTFLVRQADDRPASFGVRLLSDLRAIWGDAIALPTKEIIERLVDGDGLDDDAPWGSIKGAPVTDRMIASILKPYGIKSTKVKVHGVALKGYRRDDLWDAWTRYLSPVPEKGEPGEPEEPLTSQAPSSGNSASEIEVPPSPGEVPQVPLSIETGEPAAPLEAPESVAGSRGSPGSPSPATTAACPRCAGEGCPYCEEGWS